jgi:V/A-type H+-transporting ATPase subunit D
MIKRSFSELLRTKKDIELAPRGADVLAKVENTLTKDLLGLEEQIRSIDSDISAMMDEISKELGQARADSLLIDIDKALMDEPLENQVRMSKIKKFGKMVAQMESISPTERPPRWGASFAYERARALSKKMLIRIIELGNAQMQRDFVDSELRKTRRRVNALRKIILPDLNKKNKVLEEWMDEEVREELGRRRWVENEVIGS